MSFVVYTAAVVAQNRTFVWRACVSSFPCAVLRAVPYSTSQCSFQHVAVRPARVPRSREKCLRDHNASAGVRYSSPGHFLHALCQDTFTQTLTQHLHKGCQEISKARGKNGGRAHHHRLIEVQYTCCRRGCEKVTSSARYGKFSFRVLRSDLLLVPVNHTTTFFGKHCHRSSIRPVPGLRISVRGSFYKNFRRVLLKLLPSTPCSAIITNSYLLW